MVKRAKTHTRRVNPVARGLHLPLTPSRVVSRRKARAAKGGGPTPGRARNDRYAKWCTLRAGICGVHQMRLANSISY
jgi:hypothetical protein